MRRGARTPPTNPSSCTSSGAPTSARTSLHRIPARSRARMKSRMPFSARTACCASTCSKHLFELPALIAGQKPAKRHRVAVMTTTGGGAAAVVDRLGTFGVEVVPPSDRVVDNLARKKITIPRTRLTDLTLAGAKKEIYSAVLGELLASDHCRPRACGGRQFRRAASANRDRADRRGAARRQTARGVSRAARRNVVGPPDRQPESPVSARRNRARTRSARGATGPRPSKCPRATRKSSRPPARC